MGNMHSIPNVQGMSPNMHGQVPSGISNMQGMQNMQGQGMTPSMQGQGQDLQQGMQGQGFPPQFYNNIMSGQNSNYMNPNMSNSNISNSNMAMHQPHISPLGRTVSGTPVNNPPPAGRGRGRGRPPQQPRVQEEEPAPADIDRESVLRQMSSSSGRGHR